MADQTPPPPPPGFDTVVGAPPPPPGFDTVVGAPPPPPGFDTVVGAPAPTPPPTPSAPVDTGDPSWAKLGKVIGLRPDIEKTKGWIKGGLLTGAGLLDLVNTSARGTPEGGVEAVPMSDTVQHFSNWLRTRGAATNPDQETGQIGEAMAELGAIPEGPNKEAALKSLVERYGFLQDLAKFADKYPFMRSLMKVGLDTAATSARASAEQGIQTGLKTGDTEQTEEAMKTGAITGAALAAPASALQETAGAIRRARPGVRPVGGAFFETKPGTDELLLRNLKDVTADPATQAVDESLGHMGKTAVTNSMNRSNAARAPEGEIIPPSRRLPGRAGFDVRMTPPSFEEQPTRTATETVLSGRRTVPNPDYEAPAGELAPPVSGQTAEATAEQIGQSLTDVTPERSYTGPERSDTRNATQKRIDAARGLVPERMLTPPETIEQPVFQQRPIITQEGSQRLGGGGIFILTDDGQAISPERARQHVAQQNFILDNEELRTRQRQQIEASRDDLQRQLDRYDDFAAAQPHFAPLRPLEAARNTSSLSDAADHLKAAHGPFWDAADQASGGEFSDLRDEEKRLRKQIFGETPTGRLDELRQQLQENQQRQMDFFDQYRTTVSPAEWQTARQGYQDGIVLQNLDDLIQKNFGGITRAEEARGVAQRVFQPSANFNQQLENFYNGGFRDTDTNRQVLLRTIGQNHMDDLKQLGVMFQDATRMEQSRSLLGTISASIRRHYQGMRGMLQEAGLAGAGAGWLLGHGISGAVGGGVLGVTGPVVSGGIMGTRKFILDRLINDPAFMRQFRYAIEHNLPARTAGPLLAARMLSGWRNATQRAAAARPTTSQGAQQ